MPEKPVDAYYDRPNIIYGVITFDVFTSFGTYVHVQSTEGQWINWYFSWHDVLLMLLLVIVDRYFARRNRLAVYQILQGVLFKA